jgi:hypothetical protein
MAAEYIVSITHREKDNMTYLASMVPVEINTYANTDVLTRVTCEMNQYVDFNTDFNNANVLYMTKNFPQWVASFGIRHPFGMTIDKCININPCIMTVAMFCFAHQTNETIAGDCLCALKHLITPKLRECYLIKNFNKDDYFSSSFV